MRYTITTSQLSYFETEGFVELEGLYTEDEMKELKSLFSLAHQVNASGRDLERENPPLTAALHLPKLGQIANQLTNVKPLRLAFTQLYPPFSVKGLHAVSSISELVVGVLLDPETGAALFLSPKAEIDLTGFLLIGIAKATARYVLQENDPHTHLLKKLGYAFGDKLLDATHPLIAR